MRGNIQRFVVIAELGRGGMGTVYLARDPQLEREVAIKLLTAPAGAVGPLTTHATIDLRAQAGAAVRADDVLREARMMARLSHPHVLPIYEVGLDGDCVFLVMEYIAGSNLRAWLDGPHSEQAIRAVFAQAARGLLAAHERGIIHRDFKPDNVLVGDDGRARVADFGLAGVIAASQLVHAGDGRGTPHYMAPELWHGAPPSTASDVFALCRAIADAFDQLPAALRSVVTAGLAEDPAARPAMTALIAALDDAPAAPAKSAARRRWILPWAVTGGVAATAIAVGSLVAGEETRAGACGDTAMRVELIPLRARLFAARGAAITERVDVETTAIAAHWREACAARDRGEVGGARSANQLGCMERRAIDLGLSIERVLAHPEWPAGDAESALMVAPAANCVEINAPPIADRDRTVALHRALLNSDDLPLAERISVVAAIEHDAKLLGEGELEVRAINAQAHTLRDLDRLDEADATLQRGYRRAIAIDSITLATISLVQRSWLASRMGKLREAESYALLANDLADQRNLATRTKLRIYAVLGATSNSLGKYQIALERVQRGIDLIASTGERMPDLEVDLRVARIVAIAELGRRSEALALARDHVAWTRDQLGATNVNLGSALSLLAYHLAANGDAAGALAARRQAVEVLTEALGPDNSQVLWQRYATADELLVQGDREAARAEYAALLALSERNEGLRRFRRHFDFGLAAATFESGQLADGIRAMQRVVEEYTSELGRDHPDTLDVRTRLAYWFMLSDRLGDAEREVAAIRAAHQQRGSEGRLALAQLQGGMEAQLDLLHGRLGEAERRARESLAALDELRARDIDRGQSLGVLGAILAAIAKPAEARPVLERAIAIGAATQLRADDQADLQLELAGVLDALGERAAARELVEQASAAYAKFPFHPREQRRAERLLKQLASPPRGQRPANGHTERSSTPSAPSR